LRPRIDAQCELEFPVSSLALTQEYYAKYQAISRILDETPEIVALAHRDLKHALEQAARSELGGGRSCEWTTVRRCGSSPASAPDR
jgi:hypothetical protein